MLGFSVADGFVVAVLLAILVLYLRRRGGEVAYVTARTDGRSYLCLKLPDRQEAAERLAWLNARMLELVRHMMARAPEDPDVQRLYANFDPDAISEGSWTTGFTSFSTDKKAITLCVRQEDASFVDVNVVLYVAVHELGHLMTASIGHGDDFWANFRRLISEAVSIGIYKKVDFDEHPEPYCAISITSSVI